MGSSLSEYLVPSLGWKAIFYGQGTLALIWVLLWVFLISDCPIEHPKISNNEKQLIINSIGQQHAFKRIPVPWRSIFRYLYLFYIFKGCYTSAFFYFLISLSLYFCHFVRATVFFLFHGDIIGFIYYFMLCN